MMRLPKIAAVLCVLFSSYLISTTANAKTTPHQTLTAITAKADPVALQNIELDTKNQIECLALNLYHEARGTSEAEIMAVGFSTRNRVLHSDSPKDYCGTIWKKGQYVWTKRPVRAQVPKEEQSWERMIAYARQIITTDIKDTTKGATSFYSRHIHTPPWAVHVASRMIIGDHVFVRIETA